MSFCNAGSLSGARCCLRQSPPLPALLGGDFTSSDARTSWDSRDWMLQPRALRPSHHPIPFRRLHPGSQAARRKLESSTQQGLKKGTRVQCELGQRWQQELSWKSIGWCPTYVEDEEVQAAVQSVLIPLKARSPKQCRMHLGDAEICPEEPSPEWSLDTQGSFHQTSWASVTEGCPWQGFYSETQPSAWRASGLGNPQCIRISCERQQGPA